MTGEQDTDGRLGGVSQLKERIGRWWNRRSSATNPPPSGEPHPMTLERWERDPTEFAFARMYCEECYKGNLCEYHQRAKHSLHEYNIQGEYDGT